MNQQNRNDTSQQDSGFQSGFDHSAFGAPGVSQFNSDGGGEFSSGFEGTNAVSGIFKDGASYEEERKKKMMLTGLSVVALFACVIAVYFLYFDDPGGGDPDTFLPQNNTDNSFIETPEAADLNAPPVPGEAAPVEEANPLEGAAAPNPSEVTEVPAMEGEGAVPIEEAATIVEEPAPLAEPAPMGIVEAQSVQYDASTQGPEISLPEGSIVEFARREDFADTYLVVSQHTGMFQLPWPSPGKIFWRVQGTGEVFSMTITPPPSAGLSFTPPATLSEGTSVSWSASGPVSWYRLEVASDADFTQLISTFSTQSNAVTVSGVPPGRYYVRVGALNRSKAAMEYSQETMVDFQ